MANNHIITRQIGNLRGFSTDSIFVRPSNVADTAINIQRAPDGTIQIRRGYQCQIAAIGGLGTGTFEDPVLNKINTVTLNLDGLLYNKLERQIFLYYDGQITGTITGATQANPCVITSVAHGLITGAVIIIRNVSGMINLNNKTYTITVINANQFSLNGVNSTAFPAYTSGGTWSIAFADNNYLTFTIFTDPRFLNTNPGWSVGPWSLTPWGAPGGESITCNITVNRAAQVNGNMTNVNTLVVQFGHDLAATDVVQFYDINGVFHQQNILSVTTTSITIDGPAVSVKSGTYIAQFFDIPFRKGFDVLSPYLISTFIATITNATTGIFGLQVAINGNSNLPAAFLQIVEPIIIDNNLPYTLNYWYWQQINHTVPVTFPGSANMVYQNSQDFENASMDTFDDVIYICNGWDFPQKYDGQTVYRAGMPTGIRPSAVDDTFFPIKPFVMGNNYQYAVTYEQVDALGHIIEGAISEVWKHTIAAATAAMTYTVTYLPAGSGWNTNGASAIGGMSSSYGPDGNGFYYDQVVVNVPYTLKIGDSAYYQDAQIALINGNQSGVGGAGVITIIVHIGHGVVPGDTVYFTDATPVSLQRVVDSVTDTSITIQGSPVSVLDSTSILAYKVGLVFGDVGIVSGNQSNVNTINLSTALSGPTLQIGDVVTFIDASMNMQQRNVTAVGAGTITIDGIPVSVLNGIIIASTNQQAGLITIQRTNANPITSNFNSAISNNLRVNIYRTENNGNFAVDSELFLVASIPNDSTTFSPTSFVDSLADNELGVEFADPDRLPNPPPISKYVKAFGNQMIYGGGERGTSANSDNVFFSEGNSPESTPLATNFFSVTNADDSVSGLGVSGSTLIVTKQTSLWSVAGDLLTGQFQVVQIAQGLNIGCIAHATIQSVGSLLYFLHTNGVYGITENQIFPTDPFGNPIPLSSPIDVLFRETNYLPQTKYVLKRAVAVNYTKDNQYLLFLPCENANSTIRTANSYSIILCYDYQGKNWYQWENMNAAGGMYVINDDLYFQERRFSGVNGNAANLYKQHRFYRLVDHADHTGSQYVEWISSWEDMGQPEVRKKFCRCVLLMDRLSDLLQYNQPEMEFSTYLNRIPNLQNTIAQITTVDNVRNASWSYSPWGWGFWSGYQDTFVTVNLKGGTVAKSMQVGFTIAGINMDIRLSGFQLEAIPENRRTVVR